MKLKTKFLCLIAVLLAVSLGANLVWTSANKHAQMENELREQARALAQQMDAVWEFMVANQDRLAQVAFTEDGVYQGLHCAIAGRIIGQSFTMHSDYTTRFVNFNPRNKAGEPDGYEAAALSAFHDDASRADYYGFTDYEGHQVFRYVAPMTIDEACLQCHGEPAGELDVTGTPKEGWKMGDIGGAISIIMPLDVYQANERDSIAQDVLFFAVMLAVCLVVVYVALTYLVTRPLGKIRSGVDEVSEGNLDVRLSYSESSQEMSSLTTAFNDMAHELADVYAGLEDEVADRTAQLQQANEVLEQQRRQLEAVNAQLVDENQYKSDFLSMVSHELRTPVSALQAMVENMADGVVEPTPSNLESILNQTHRLSDLIAFLLDLSRMEAGAASLQIDKFNFADFIDETVEPLEIADAGHAHNIEIHVPDDIEMEGDQDRLRQLFTNIIANALKHSADNTAVLIEAHENKDFGTIVTNVVNFGSQIPQEARSDIFRRFVKGKTGPGTESGGTGLGLSIARWAAQLHGGTVRVVDDPRGADFEITLPKYHISDDE